MYTRALIIDDMALKHPNALLLLLCERTPVGKDRMLPHYHIKPTDTHNTFPV